MSTHLLNRLFNPKGVAVIGASDKRVLWVMPS